MCSSVGLLYAEQRNDRLLCEQSRVPNQLIEGAERQHLEGPMYAGSKATCLCGNESLFLLFLQSGSVVLSGAGRKPSR